MRAVLAVSAGLLLAGCDFQLFEPDASLRVDPQVVDIGVSRIEITDEARRQDFREVVDVESYGDFYVREWSSNDQRVFLEIDVFDDAFGSQEVLVRLESDDVLQAWFTVQ